MNGFVTQKNWFYRLQQLIILVLHFILLYWMYFALSESGHWSTEAVTLHFFGMAIFGALLIVGCAKWAKYHHLKEQK